MTLMVFATTLKTNMNGLTSLHRCSLTATCAQCLRQAEIVVKFTWHQLVIGHRSVYAFSCSNVSIQSYLITADTSLTDSGLTLSQIRK